MSLFVLQNTFCLFLSPQVTGCSFTFWCIHSNICAHAIALWSAGRVVKSRAFLNFFPSCRDGTHGLVHATLVKYFRTELHPQLLLELLEKSHKDEGTVLRKVTRKK